jgi:hypothetical protein
MRSPAKLADAQTELAAAQDQAEAVCAQAAVAQMAQAEAEADAAELRQAEASRKDRGRLARLRAAWRGVWRWTPYTTPVSSCSPRC